MVRLSAPSSISCTLATLPLSRSTLLIHAQQADSATVHATFKNIVTANTCPVALKNDRLPRLGADWPEARSSEINYPLKPKRQFVINFFTFNLDIIF